MMKKNTEEEFKVFNNIVNEILEDHKFNYCPIETEIVDETFVVSCEFWYIEFCKDGYFNVGSREGCGIDRDSLELIKDIADNTDYIFLEIEKHL